MLKYGQFCPIAKAMEILGERWTLLIIRELLMGARRFSDLQHGLPNISPTMLNRRLAELADSGLIEKTRLKGQRRHAYHLTPAGRELEAALVELGSWGMRWARGPMQDEELHVQQLMYNIQRHVIPSELPRQGRSIIHFRFTDLKDYPNWWLKIDDELVDLCIEAPGEDSDLLIETDLRCLTEIWMGDTRLEMAVRTGRIRLLGQIDYERSISRWLGRHRLADVRPAD